MPPVASDAQLSVAADRVVRALAGPGAAPRADQVAAARAAAVDGGGVLVVQATGWGKSAVYWIATAALRTAGAGPTLVVSPLLALMRDQVAAAGRAGLRAATVNSTNLDEWDAAHADLAADRIDVLLVSPERLANADFRARVLSGPRRGVGLLVIDEAHCLSSWGHDFRPDYLRLARLLIAVPDVPVIATTATANARVSADVAATLGPGTTVLRGPLARDSLRLAVVDRLSPVQRFGWVDQALRVLPGSGIVYCLTVADVQRLAGFLADRGHQVAAYTGRTETDERARVEAELAADRVKAVVATSALGMGYDKGDLAFVVHVGSPASPVDLYQMIGRAGRAIDTAAAVLLPGPSDARLWEWFATAAIPDPDHAERVLAELDRGPASVPALEASTGIRRGRLELLLRTLHVDGAVGRDGPAWVRTDAAWSYDHARYADLRRTRAAEAELMRRYAEGQACLMTFLRRALDDPDADVACGRCSVCTGRLPLGLSAAVAPEAAAAALAWLRRQDTPLEPRQMWPSGMAGDRRGRIPAGRRAATGRAVGFADDPAWWPALAPVVADGARDATLTPELASALVAVLTRWRADWPDRPVAVVPVPSASRPLLVRAAAEHVAAVGRLPVLDVLRAAGPAPDRDLAPSARGRALADRLRLDDSASLPAGPVLLVDDTWVTGWTATLAADLLRAAGTGPVYPLVLHRRP